jgi:hypothetical protein
MKYLKRSSLQESAKPNTLKKFRGNKNHAELTDRLKKAVMKNGPRNKAATAEKKNAYCCLPKETFFFFFYILNDLYFLFKSKMDVTEIFEAHQAQL